MRDRKGIVNNKWWKSSAPFKPLTKKQKEKLWKDIYSKCVRGSDEPDVVVLKVKKNLNSPKPICKER